MLVRDRMTPNPVTIEPEAMLPEAFDLMKRNKIRRLPVVRSEKLVGILTELDILKFSPSPATSLSVWEINYLISKIKVREVMTRDPITVREDAPVEEAALLMRDNKVGALPVLGAKEPSRLMGIITESDIFDAFVDMLGLRRGGVRVTVRVEDRPGVLAALAGLARELGVNILSVVTSGPKEGRGLIVLRLNGENVQVLVDRMKAEGYDIVSS